MDDESLKSIEVQMLINVDILKSSEFNIRPMIIQLAKLFNCKVNINDKELGLEADARSFWQLVDWEFTHDKNYVIKAQGDDADVAIEAFREAFESRTSEQMYSVYHRYRNILGVDRMGNKPSEKIIEKSEKVRVLFDTEGVHMRPSMVIVTAASQFDSDIAIKIAHTESYIDIKSIMMLSFLSLTYGTEIQLLACGPDADIAVDTLKELFQSQKLWG